MPYTDQVVNASESYNADNFSKEGNEVLVSPKIAVGSLAKNAWARAGYFDPGDDITPTTNTSTTDRKAQNPTGGPDITIATETTEASAVLDSIAPLTPTKEITELHAGSPAVAVGTPGDGITASAFTIGANIPARLIIIKRRLTPDPARIQKVLWFPNVGLMNNGTVTKQERNVPNFRATILSWDDNIVDTAIAAAVARPTMGTIFNVPNDKLDAFLIRLMAEAPAA